MYNYSAPTSRHRHGGNKHLHHPLDNLPAVPERHSSASLFDPSSSLVKEDQSSFNLYDSIDQLDLNFDKDGDEDDNSSLSMSGGQRRAGGSLKKDEFMVKMEHVEQSMKRVGLPRFRLPDRPLRLAEGSDVFVDIDRSNTQRMEIFLPKIERGDVLCIDVVCVPSDMHSFDLIDICEGSYNKAVDHEPLDISLAPASATSEDGDTLIGPTARPHSPFVPVYHNGEYEYNLTSAHGITSGRYILSVANTGNYTQSIRVKMKVRPYVQATAVNDQEVITINDVPQDEFCYFRFVLKDRSKFVSIRLIPLDNAAGVTSDPDLYVSNKYAGLVAVDRDNFIWRSTNIGVDQVDIHPDDLNAQRSGIFIIGVLGYKDLNSFSLEVTVGPPIRFIDLKLGSHDLVVRTDRYTYYRVPVDSNVKSKLVIGVTPVDENGYSSDLADIDQFGKFELENRFGRGVYTADSLVSAGVFPQSQSSMDTTDLNSLSTGGGGGVIRSLDEVISLQLSRSSVRSTNSTHSQGGTSSPTRRGMRPITQDNIKDSDKLTVLLDSLPESLAKKNGVYPVIHLSSDCMYPTAAGHTWRASSILGNTKAMIESDEWLHTTSKFCYLSVIGVVLPRPLPSNFEDPQELSKHEPESVTPQQDQHIIDTQTKLTSPILPTLGAAPLGNSSGRFMRSQNTILEMKARSENDEAKSTMQLLSGAPNGETVSPTSISCKISLDSILDGSDMSSVLKMRYQTFSAIFDEMDGSSISQSDRIKSGELDVPNFTYGEIEFPSFVRLLEDVGARDGQVFVDLGCGCGKAVLAAALSGIKFSRCIGIEQLPGLCKAARVAVEKFKSKMNPRTSSPQRRFSQQRPSVSFPSNSQLQSSSQDDELVVSNSSYPMLDIWEGDLVTLGYDDENTAVNGSTSSMSCSWSQADIVFASSICFSDSLMQNILNIAKSLKRGGMLLTLKLPEHFNAQFKLVRQEWVKMSWGRCLVYVLRRL